MSYIQEDAIREVGNSTDWLVGLEASIKKYEQRVAGDVGSYQKTERCGLCFVAGNRGIDRSTCTHCLASSICAGGVFTIDTSEEILQALKKLRKELDPMDCKDKCANYKPIEVKRPTDHPNRIFAEDLRVGMVIRRHGTGYQRRLVVILDESARRFYHLRHGNFVPSLQLLAGYEPECRDLALAPSGLKPYDSDGSWDKGAWCEEVT